MTITEAKKLLKKYRVPANVLAHILRVTALCLYLGQKLKRNGIRINLPALKKAALLHDLVKICDFKDLNQSGFGQKVNSADLKLWRDLIKKYGETGHVEAAYQILKDLNEHNLAEIVRKHKFSCLIDPDPSRRPVTWEEKILYYADKRTKHDWIVSVRERISDLNKRYAKNPLSEKSKSIGMAIHKLERKLCQTAGLKPEDLTDQTVGSYHL